MAYSGATLEQTQSGRAYFYACVVLPDQGLFDFYVVVKQDVEYDCF
jgi:hypothetical protein